MRGGDGGEGRGSGRGRRGDFEGAADFGEEVGFPGGDEVLREEGSQYASVEKKWKNSGRRRGEGAGRRWQEGEKGGKQRTCAKLEYQMLVHPNNLLVSLETLSQSCSHSARRSRSALVLSVRMALAPHLVASIISERELTVQT